MSDNFWRCPYCRKLTLHLFKHHCPEKDGKIVANPAATEQPKPTKSVKSKVVLDRVIADLKARGEEGEKKYGSPLMTHNGRDALMDAYQESLDLCQYLAQKIMEVENG